MNTVVRLGLAGCLALVAMPLGAEEKVDTSNIMVKQAIADTMTPEQLQAYKERLARNLAARRRARIAHRAVPPGPDTPSDTCPTAKLENGPFPYGPTPSTTVGDTDTYDLPADVTNPTCAASTTCTGAGPASSLPRGAIYTGTGTGPDRAFHIKTDANCDLTINMDPTADDLALIVYQTTCSSLLSDCVCVSDTGLPGDLETVTLNAVANTDYFVVVDGYSTNAVPPGPAGPFTLGITTTGTCNLVIPPSQYHTVTPCRLVDTRNPNGPFGGPALVAGADRTFDVDAGSCGVPATADAVFLNVTVVGPAAAGNVRLWATGDPFPAVSALNFSAAQTRGNNGVIKLNGTGQFTIRSNQNTDVIIDVAGYFEE